MPRSLKHLPERDTHLPADKNESNSLNSQFRTLIKPFSKDAAREGAFAEIAAELENLHYQYEITEFPGRIGRISLLCNDYYKIHISPMRDEKRIEIPMTIWHEFDGSLREYYEEHNHGVAGYYSYQAEFELIIDEWDPEADEDSPRFIDNGEGSIGSVDCSAHNFQEFIEAAVSKLSVKFDTELYPKRVPLKREIT